MNRRSWIVVAMVFLVLLLSGCVPGTTPTPIDPENSQLDKYLVAPVSDALDFFAGKLGGEYGLSILVVTIIIRIIILPLTLKQYQSSKKMQDIQPELKKIKEKYKDDPKKQQEETMRIFQANGVNPLAGCLPLIVQMPILIALYQAIMRNSHISDHSFLWMQLGAMDPYYILPLLAALTTYLQQRMMASQMNPQMKALMYIFPVMIFVMAMNFAAALPLYWIYSNVFTIVQSYFIYRPDRKKDGLVDEKTDGKS